MTWLQGARLKKGQAVWGGQRGEVVLTEGQWPIFPELLTGFLGLTQVVVQGLVEMYFRPSFQLPSALWSLASPGSHSTPLTLWCKGRDIALAAPCFESWLSPGLLPSFH